MKTFANSLDPDQARQKVDLEKKSADDKKRGQGVKYQISCFYQTYKKSYHIYAKCVVKVVFYNGKQGVTEMPYLS